MATIALNSKNDVFSNQDGLAHVSGKDQIIQEIKQNILSIGIDNYIGSGVSAERLGVAIKSKILETEGVSSLSEFSISRSGNGCGLSSFLSIRFSVNTNFGQIGFR